MDPDVEKYVRDACHKQKKSFKQIVNNAIRDSLKPRYQELPELPPPVKMGLLPGIDHHNLSDLVSDLEIEDYLEIERANATKVSET